MTRSFRLLLVEESDEGAAAVLRQLGVANLEPQTTRVDTASALRHALASGSSWDLAICGNGLGAVDASGVVSLIRDADRDLPVVVVSDAAGEQAAVAAMRAGAHDYLTTDNADRIGQVVGGELAAADLRRDGLASTRAFLSSEDRLRFALEAARMGVWDWDIAEDQMQWEAGTPQFWNIEGGGGLRGNFDHFMGIVYTDDRATVARAFAEARKGRRPFYAVEHRVTTGADRVRWIDVRGRVFFDGAGRATRMAGTFLDVTPRRALDGQQAQSEKMKTIGQLAEGIAHDLNNSLTVILTHNQLVEGRHGGDTGVSELTSPIRAAGERAAALARQLLVFSRPELVIPQVLALNEVIKSATKSFRASLDQNVYVEMELADGAWNLRMDRSQCEQVILDLAMNARDAMPTGGRLRLVTRNAPAGSVGEGAAAVTVDSVVFEVIDSGEGMTADVQRKLFQPFFTTKGPGRGTGLGLATCLAVVTNAGGTIDLESAPGRGTTFRLIFPRCDEPADLVAVTDGGLRHGSATERILVVDDDALVRATAERALCVAGYTVDVAGDGEEALRILQTLPGAFRLLMTEVAMPRMGGVELAEVVRIRLPAMKVLFTSGCPIDQKLRQALAKGTPLLPKPYNAGDLTGRIRDLLDDRVPGA